MKKTKVEDAALEKNIFSKESGMRREFAAYEYKEINVRDDQASFYLDCYENFGWQQDENFPIQESNGRVNLKLKRNRRIINKVELVRLQRQFEADMEDLSVLEKSKATRAQIASITVGVLGTACMAGSVFAVTAAQPVIWLCVLLAVPAFAGWISPYFIYRKLKEKKTREVTPYIDEKYEEIYAICEKGNSLL